MPEALVEAGITTSEDPAEIGTVLTSYDRGFAHRKLQIAFDALWFHKRAVLMSTDPDRLGPFQCGRGEPGAASIVAAIEAATRVTLDRSFGKPSALMAEMALDGLNVRAGDSGEADIAPVPQPSGRPACLSRSGSCYRPPLPGRRESRPHGDDRATVASEESGRQIVATGDLEPFS